MAEESKKILDRTFCLFPTSRSSSAVWCNVLSSFFELAANKRIACCYSLSELHVLVLINVDPGIIDLGNDDIGLKSVVNNVFRYLLQTYSILCCSFFLSDKLAEI